MFFYESHTPVLNEGHYGCVGDGDGAIGCRLDSGSGGLAEVATQTSV